MTPQCAHSSAPLQMADGPMWAACWPLQCTRACCGRLEAERVALSCASGMSRGRQSPKPFSASWVSLTQLVPRAASIGNSLQSALAAATGRQAQFRCALGCPLWQSAHACQPGCGLHRPHCRRHCSASCWRLSGQGCLRAGKLCAVQSASLRASARCSGVGSNLQSTQLGCRVQAAPGQSRWWGPW